MAKSKTARPDAAPPGPRCCNCRPWFIPSDGKPKVGMCVRFPHAEVIRNKETHFCGEHPAFKASPLSPADLVPAKA